MTNYGFVSHISGRFATVEVSRTSACSMMHENLPDNTCDGHCDGCASMLKKMSVRAENPLGAVVGQRVEIESESKNILLLSLLVFVCPIVLLVFAYMVFRLFLSESLSVLFGLIVFALCYVALRIFDQKLSARFSCRIIRIL